MDFGGMGNHLVFQMVSLGQRAPRKDWVHSPRKRNWWGHSLAEAPSHHNAFVVVQGNLGHSPDSLLKGPRLTVVSAQGADVLATQLDGDSYAQLLCACGMIPDAQRMADFRWLDIVGTFVDEMQIRRARFRRSRLDPRSRLKGQNILDFRLPKRRGLQYLMNLLRR